LGLLNQAKTLGGIGSILELIPGISIVGYILTLIAVKYVSDSLQDRSIFNNMIYAVITGIIGAAVGAGFVFSGVFFSVFTSGLSGIFGVVAFLGIIWISLIISAIFIRRSFDTMATRLNIKSFRTAGTLYFVGAILTIVLIGFVILLIAYIFQIVAFFSIEEAPSQVSSAWQQQPTTSTMQATTPQPSAVVGESKFCQACGASMTRSAAFCPVCGARQ
jgi:uncharacterized membrane protein